jgi:hypothetical protein
VLATAKVSPSYHDEHPVAGSNEQVLAVALEVEDGRRGEFYGFDFLLGVKVDDVQAVEVLADAELCTAGR